MLCVMSGVFCVVCCGYGVSPRGRKSYTNQKFMQQIIHKSEFHTILWARWHVKHVFVMENVFVVGLRMPEQNVN